MIAQTSVPFLHSHHNSTDNEFEFRMKEKLSCIQQKKLVNILSPELQKKRGNFSTSKK